MSEVEVRVEGEEGVVDGEEEVGEGVVEVEGLEGEII